MPHHSSCAYAWLGVHHNDVRCLLLLHHRWRLVVARSWLVLSSLVVRHVLPFRELTVVFKAPAGARVHIPNTTVLLYYWETCFFFFWSRSAGRLAPALERTPHGEGHLRRLNLLLPQYKGFHPPGHLINCRYKDMTS